jgi:hypothetical protein
MTNVNTELFELNLSPPMDCKFRCQALQKWWMLFWEGRLQQLSLITVAATSPLQVIIIMAIVCDLFNDTVSN